MQIFLSKPENRVFTNKDSSAWCFKSRSKYLYHIYINYMPNDNLEFIDSNYSAIVWVWDYHIGNDWYFALDDIFIDTTTVTKIVEEWYSQLNIGECLSPNYFHLSTGVSQSKSIFKEFWVIECQYQKNQPVKILRSSRARWGKRTPRDQHHFNALEQFRKHIKST